LVFDGGSYAVDAKGRIIAQSMRFVEDLNVIDLDFKKKIEGGTRELSEDANEILRSALVLGLKDFVAKTGFKKVHVGLSGGIDSALVACLAVDALGPMNVTAVSLPGPFTSGNSEKWAKQLAENLGIRWIEFSITKDYEEVLKGIEAGLGKRPFDLMNENLQSRLRGLHLMALSNQEKSMLLGTTNKSEIAVGYGTLYGDLIGGILPIGDLLKTEVFTLSRHYNSQAVLIPPQIIERPPSAELREDQTDQDSLPPYDVLDAAIFKLVEGLNAPETEVERRVLDMMMKSEFKRWQAPPIIKVSDHAFGRGRRFPIAHRAKA
jgi:NAD+ synthase (glutamine-hydrolysing)